MGAEAPQLQSKSNEKYSKIFFSYRSYTNSNNYSILFIVAEMKGGKKISHCRKYKNSNVYFTISTKIFKNEVK